MAKFLLLSDGLARDRREWGASHGLREVGETGAAGEWCRSAGAERSQHIGAEVESGVEDVAAAAADRHDGRANDVRGPRDGAPARVQHQRGARHQGPPAKSRQARPRHSVAVTAEPEHTRRHRRRDVREMGDQPNASQIRDRIPAADERHRATAVDQLRPEGRSHRPEQRQEAVQEPGRRPGREGEGSVQGGRRIRGDEKRGDRRGEQAGDQESVRRPKPQAGGSQREEDHGEGLLGGAGAVRAEDGAEQLGARDGQPEAAVERGQREARRAGAQQYGEGRPNRTPLRQIRRRRGRPRRQALEGGVAVRLLLGQDEDQRHPGRATGVLGALEAARAILLRLGRAAQRQRPLPAVARAALPKRRLRPECGEQSPEQHLVELREPDEEGRRAAAGAAPTRLEQ